jgi:hypothetical protein
MPQPEWMQAAATLLRIVRVFAPNAWVADSAFAHKCRCNHYHFLTAFSRTDTFILGKELVGENRGVDRILRSLKLHAEGRQFGDQNS